MTNLENYIIKYANQSPDWTHAIKNFGAFSENSREFTGLEASSIYNETTIVLCEILRAITGYEGTRVEWQELTSRPILNGIQSELITKDFKTHNPCLFNVRIQFEGIKR